MVENRVQGPPSARTRQDRPTRGIAGVTGLVLPPGEASPTGEEIIIVSEEI